MKSQKLLFLFYFKYPNIFNSQWFYVKRTVIKWRKSVKKSSKLRDWFVLYTQHIKSHLNINVICPMILLYKFYWLIFSAVSRIIFPPYLLWRSPGSPFGWISSQCPAGFFINRKYWNDLLVYFTHMFIGKLTEERVYWWRLVVIVIHSLHSGL